MMLTLGFIAICSTTKAQGKLKEWNELKEFHKVMSQTFHPSEEGNLEPIKTRSGEMVEKAKALQASKAPASFDTENVKNAVNKLVSGSESLDKAIKAGTKDKKIKKSLSALHDTFHEIIGLCSEIEEAGHDHPHGEGEHNHNH